MLVVGGGDSAIEAAVALADQPGTDVAPSYRGEAFNRTRRQNRDAITAAVADDRVTLHLQSRVEDIGSGHVSLRYCGEQLDVPNDHVIVCAGGELSTGFLHSMGIRVERKFGTVGTGIVIDTTEETKTPHLKAA
ncbi:FAD-dependent oxidoreductase [Sphingopyxis sp. MSC1_008]|uniref:FAD-dependent oxidoreductase n=1 Tax=Sphingopyxis sp. MSC1_008 TaxID=2909265 RepID=UPI0032C03212